VARNPNAFDPFTSYHWVPFVNRDFFPPRVKGRKCDVNCTPNFWAKKFTTLEKCAPDCQYEYALAFNQVGRTHEWSRRGEVGEPCGLSLALYTQRERLAATDVGSAEYWAAVIRQNRTQQNSAA